MQEVNDYIKKLRRLSKKHFYKEYDIKEVKFSDFQWINFSLIDNCLKNEHNLFIESFDKQLPVLSQFPAVLSVAISMFFKNYCDNDMSYEKGDIVQKNRFKFKIIKINKEDFWLKGVDRGNPLTKIVNQNQISSYTVVNSGMSKRRVKVGVKEYKEFYNILFNVGNEIPSKFKYKSAIIMSKSDFEEELKTQKYIDSDIKKSIPMRWIAQSGTINWKHLPIEPMIYCVPDFETLETHILDKGINIETLVVIGKNKYKDEVNLQIRKAIQTDRIPHCIVLGSEGFQDDQKQFLHWKWTFPEYRSLENISKGGVNTINIRDDNFEKKINIFLKTLQEIESRGITLAKVKGLRRFLYALVLSRNDKSRNLLQLEYVKQLLKKAACEAIEQDFYELGLDEMDTVKDVIQQIDMIFANFNNQKLKYLETCNNLDYLIVPKRLLQNWKDDFLNKKIEIYSLKEFINFQQNISDSKNICILSLYNNDMYIDEVLDISINSHHNFFFLSYAEETQIITNHITNYQNNLITEYQSGDRKKLTGLNFKMKPKEIIKNKSLEDIMDNLYSKKNGTVQNYDYESESQVNYHIRFEEENESLVYNGSKVVLMKKEKRWIKSKTYNLFPGDEVRFYNNLSKDRLFDIAVQEDNNERFQEIDKMSRIWKQVLKKYFSHRVIENLFYDVENLLDSLQSKGSKITNSLTITKWLSEEDKERFPHSDNELKAIKKLVEDPVFDTVFPELLRVKRFYRGIMIRLGRDLSDDVMDFIISDGKEKGVILSKFEDSEIESFIKSAAPIRTIKSKTITEDEELN